METRISPELGLKNVSYFRPLNQGEPPVRKEAPIPGEMMETKQERRIQMASNAVLPNQAAETFRVKGAVIDIQA
ncbi:MAG: hypothetical protein NZ853_03995 [Leptospiraceae bacterium]|nr:hypothetical protein [Leptospiraceae bacterium]MDW7975337.1 hypothetical protein [Leptospiraceae bacterium]